MNDLKLKKITLDLINNNSLTAKRLTPHIRKNKISNHPAVIIGEDGRMYLFLSLTSQPIKNSKKLMIKPNPKEKNRESYVIFRMRANKKSAFTAPLNWQLSSEDLAKILEYAKSKIK